MPFVFIFSLVQLFFILPAKAQVYIKCGKALEQSLYPMNEAKEVFSSAPFEFNCEIKNNQTYAQSIKSIKFGGSDCEEIKEPGLEFLGFKKVQVIPQNQKHKIRLKCKNTGGIGPYKNNIEVLTTGKKTTIMRKDEEVVSSKGKIETQLKYPESSRLDQAGCDPVDMSKKGGSMEFVPPTFQLTGNCFAQQASQLYDAYRFKNGTNHQKLSSPADIALTYWLRTGNRDFNGGFSQDALAQILNDGACPRQFLDEKSISDNFYRKYDKDELLLSSVETITAKYKKLMSESKGSDLKWYKNDFNCEMSNLAKGYTAFSKVSKKNVFDLEKILEFNSKEKNSVPQTVKLLKDDNILLCQKKEKLLSTSPYKVIQHSTSRERSGLVNPKIGSQKIDAKQLELLRVINAELDKGAKNALPLGVSLCSNVFNTGVGCGGHATVLTGRRFNPATQKCEYKIRTHWSNACKKYLYKNVSECNDKTGEIWTDASSFLPATDRVIQLGNK